MKKIHFHQITAHAITEDIMQVAGDYDVICSGNGRVKRIAYEILVTYQGDEILYLQLSTIKQGFVIHKVRAVNEDYYSVAEDEVLYIEVNHNHVTWNCTDYTVIANDSLRRLEEALSDHFVRIQRGYLVNKDYVKCIRRCEVVMENGNTLPIPSKKYVSVKEKLMS
ncbi:MAG: LytTR family DNA-binding domain-containing protein [bacterium]|nr:LytTR family DNA-binding domain-containing protein [bacterium]